MSTLSDYGAVGDGVADDTGALRLAIADRVLRGDPIGKGQPKKRYRFTDTLNIQLDDSDIDLNGAVLVPDMVDKQWAIVFSPAHTQVPLTLASDADPASTTGRVVPFTSVTGVNVGDIVRFLWDNPDDMLKDPSSSGHQFVSQVTAVDSVATTITLADPLGEAIRVSYPQKSIFAWTPLRNPRFRGLIDLSNLGRLRIVTAISNASPGVFTYDGPSLSSGSKLILSAPIGNSNNPHVNMNELSNALVEVVATPSTSTCTLKYSSTGDPVNTTGYSGYVSGALLREFVSGVQFVGVDSADIDLELRDCPGGGYPLAFNISYAPRGRARVSNCGSGIAESFAFGGVGLGSMELRADELSGWGAYMRVNGGAYRYAGFGGARFGRGLKLAGAQDSTHYLPDICGGDFTSLALAWGARRNKLFGGSANGENHGVQDIGIWFSDCCNTDNLLVGVSARNNRLENVEINASDERNTFVGCVIDADLTKVIDNTPFPHTTRWIGSMGYTDPDMAAWTQPSDATTVTATVGSFTTAAATVFFKKIGRTCHVRVELVVTTNGTAAGWAQLSLPFAATSNGGSQWLTGCEHYVSARSIRGQIPQGASYVYLQAADGGAWPGGDGAHCSLSGAYETG